MGTGTSVLLHFIEFIGFCQQQGVKGFPTLRPIVNGRIGVQYANQYTEENIRQFVEGSAQ